MQSHEASSQVLAKQLQLSAQQIETRLVVGDDDLCHLVNQNGAVLIDASAGYWIGQSSEAARFVQVRRCAAWL